MRSEVITISYTWTGKLDAELPILPTEPRTIWLVSELEHPEKRLAYQEALQLSLADWKASCNPLFNNLLGLNPPPNTKVVAAALDASYLLLTESIQKSLANTVSTKVVRPESRSYWDDDLQDLVKKRSAAYRLAKEHGQLGLDQPFAVYWNRYTELRKEVHKLASARKEAKYQSLLDGLETSFSNDRKHFFREISKLRKKHTTPNSLLALRHTTPNSDVLITSEPDEIKQILFDFHSSLGRHDPNDSRFDRTHLDQVQSAVATVSDSEVGGVFCEIRITLLEIETALRSLENNKAPGLDSILNESLKYGGDMLVEALQVLFNFILKVGICPTIWRKATIHLIFKEGGLDPLDASAYRPISLTSCLSKVYERVILNRLTSHLELNNLLPEEQAGFRQKRGTLEQAFILRESLDSRKPKHPTFAAFIDLTNAFPSTWQDGMWLRLREVGVTGSLYRSIRSLYSSCQSAIQTQFGLTEWFESDLGTRQGAVLSPLLFSLLINPLATLLKEHGFGIRLINILIAILLYADDIVLLERSEPQLQAMLNIATEFFKNVT